MFKVGDKVKINPKWNEGDIKDDYGIGVWRNYVGKIYTIGKVLPEENDIVSYVFLEEGWRFIWPDYMLQSVDENSISYLLEKRNV